jgi:hypothetical protein
MPKLSSKTENAKGRVEKVLNQISPATVGEIVKQSGVPEHAVKANLCILRKEGRFTCTYISKLYVWHKIGEIDNKVYYHHVPKVYQEKKAEKIVIAGRREWQAGTTGPLVWKGWDAPARAGAMDAYALPSRGM